LAASPEQLTQATLDYQAEIIHLTAIQKSMSEALMTMELQLRSLEALPPKAPEPQVEPRMSEAPNLRAVKLTQLDKVYGGSCLKSSTGLFSWSLSLLPAPNSSDFMTAFA
jgi:hypothetical protein